jgi:hypothetical protein
MQGTDIPIPTNDSIDQPEESKNIEPVMES